MRQFPVWLLLSSAACQEPGEDKDGGQGGGPGNVEGGYVVRTVQHPGCSSLPGPRQHALMTSFVYPDLFSYGNDRRTERGFLLLGGETANGTPLDDLWLYDLSRPWDSCPWYRLAESATDWSGVADGALVFTREDGAFTVVGGRVHSGDGWSPLGVTLQAGSLGNAFSSRGANGLATAVRVSSKGDPVCPALVEVECYCTSVTCGPPSSSVQLGDSKSTWAFGLGGSSRISVRCASSRGSRSARAPPTWSV